MYIVVNVDSDSFDQFDDLNSALLHAAKCAANVPNNEYCIYQKLRCVKAAVTLNHFNADGSPVK